MQEPEGSLLLDPEGGALFTESVRARLTSDAIGNAVTFGRLLLRQTYGTKYLLSPWPNNVVRFIGG